MSDSYTTLIYTIFDKYLSDSMLHPTQPLVVRGKVILNLITNEVRLGEEIAKLTLNESKVLYVLMNNAEHTISSEKIAQEVWGKEHMNTDSVRTYIRRLRDKLKDKPPQIILSGRGQGYRFVSPT